MGLAGGIIGASVGMLVIVGGVGEPHLDPGARPAGSRSARRCSARSSACCPAPIPPLRAAALEPVEALRAGT